MIYLHDGKHINGSNFKTEIQKQITKKIFHLAVQGHEPLVGCVCAAATRTN